MLNAGLSGTILLVMAAQAFAQDKQNTFHCISCAMVRLCGQVFGERR